MVKQTIPKAGHTFRYAGAVNLPRSPVQVNRSVCAVKTAQINWPGQVTGEELKISFFHLHSAQLTRAFV